MQQPNSSAARDRPASAADWPWLFARAFASSAVSLLLLDPEGPELPIVYASHGFERLTGFPADDPAGRSLRMLAGPETDPAALCALDALVGERRPGRVLLRHYRKDGTTFWDDLSLDPVRGMDGRVCNYLAVQVDVTKQVEAEEALRRHVALVSRAKNDWEATVDSLPELVLLVDGRMRVLRTNRTVESWKLGSVYAVRGRDLHSLLHPRCFSDCCHLLEQWRRLEASAGGAHAIDCNAFDEQLGRRLQVTMCAARLSGRARLDRVSVVLRDVSEIHERQEIQRRRERFEAMGFLVAGLAHEIGNPLAAMKTTLEVWSQNFDDFDRELHRRYLARLGEGVDRLRASVERILGREERAGRQGFSPVPVRAAIERTRRLFEDQARERQIDVVVSIGERLDPDAMVLGEAAAIDGVLANLTKNAIEACGKGARVSIEAWRDGDQIVVRIADTGGGIPRDDMRNLFVPFFTTKPQGTGIGLAHVNHLMDEMGGRVSIESAQGVGTSATLRFRRAPTNARG